MTSSEVRKLPRGRIRKDEGVVGRFFAFVEKTDACWLWLGTHDEHGYGHWRWKGHVCNAHRAAYELFVGPIPQGLYVDHLCRNRRCVRPDHLEPKSNRDNILCGTAPTAVNAAKTQCANGHPFDTRNTYVTKQGYRQCRACDAARRRRYRAAARRPR